MGIAVLIDILGSMVVGGYLLLMLFNINDTTTRNTYNFGGELSVQENLVTTVEVLEYDFRKIGYCEDPAALPRPEESAIRYADTSEVIFLTDLMIPPDYDRGDGIVDTIRYYLGPASEASGTPNPNDRILYRKVNGRPPVGANLGVTHFKVRFFRDSLTVSGGTTLAEIPPGNLPKMYVPGTPTGITAMQIDIKVENTSTYDPGSNSFRSAFWRQIRISSRNLKR